LDALKFDHKSNADQALMAPSLAEADAILAQFGYVEAAELAA
jgi:hypothetical protein